MKVKVTFLYDEESENWDVEVEGAKDATEAKQAFNAIVLTLRHPKLDIGLRHLAMPTIDRADTYRITPAMRIP